MGADVMVSRSPSSPLSLPEHQEAGGVGKQAGSHPGVGVPFGLGAGVGVGSGVDVGVGVGVTGD